MKPKHLLWTSIAGVLLWAGYLAYRAHTNLVTLDVRNMDVHRVISKIEWQTWEKILLNKSVSGRVTLNVHKVPLEEVLNIIALQTSTRWTAFYPIYSTGKSGAAFNKVVKGELTPDGSGWLNLQKPSIWQWKGLNGFASVLRSENKLVSAQFMDKDLDFAALALSRFSQAQVVPEDNAKGIINLKLDQVPFTKAVAQVAKQVHRKWKQVYAIQPMNGPVMVKKSVAAPEQTPDAPIGAAPAPPVAVVRQPNERTPEQLQEAFLATMTPAERQKAQEQISTMQQLNSLPPEERQQRMQETVSQAKQAAESDTMRRIQLRLKNGTPDQRVSHDRSELQKKKSREKQ